MTLAQPSSSSAPRRAVAPAWPVALVGGIAGAALVVLMALDRLRLADGAMALAVVALAAGVALMRRGRGGEAAMTDAPSADAEAEAPPYAALVNGLPDPILVIAAQEADDLTGRRYIFANSAARELLRIQEGQGRLVSVIRDPQVLEAVDEALFGGLDAETIYEMGGAQSRVLRAYARPLGLALDGGRLALLMLRDETEARQMERTRSDFLANASHELRTPLASLTGFIETLRGHARDDSAARDRFLGIMHAQAERMSRLIADLMSLSRIELNEHIAPEDRVDLVSAVADVLDAVGLLARERRIVLETDLPPRGTALVSGDRDQIVQVAQNLVDNAMKYSPAGAAVQVSVKVGLTADAAAQGGRSDLARLSLLTPDHSGGAYALLRITDKGPGIARENLPRLTERFYRVEGQKSGERSGTGLGLAIVKHIANRHRGGLAVESAPGQGTTFSVYFPLAPEAAAALSGGRRETVT